MAFLFKSKPKSPIELVGFTKDALLRLERDPGAKRTLEDLAKYLQDLKHALYGDHDKEPNPEQTSLIAQEIYAQDVLPLLAHGLGNLDLEARKDAVLVFSNLLNRQIGTRLPTVEYVAAREDILMTLLSGYDNPAIALSCGMILRESLPHEALANIILKSSNFWSLFRWIDSPAFDLASDAWATFKLLLTKHKALVAAFLTTSYDPFFQSYSQLLISQSYLTRLFALRLLTEILVERANQQIMIKWTSDPENLKRVMILMRDKSHGVAKEALTVFKIFMSSTNKAPPIVDILVKNKAQLSKLIGAFYERADDEQSVDEKTKLLSQIEAL